MAYQILKTEYPHIGETLYRGVLDNGLQIFVIPKKGFRSSYAVFATHYGGAMRRFSVGGQVTDTPAGVAHFLEHKMFDMPDGSNALTLFAENGADPNAFTANDITCYHFSCTDRFEENFRLLLSYVSTPFYTPETVQKEQGIITQEIRMGDDSPARKIYYNLLSILYDHHPIRDAVVGTVESISQITDRTLYDCHSVFYAPSNMVLCVEGDVDPEQIFSIAEELLPSRRSEVPHADFGSPESLLPLQTRIEEEMPVGAAEFLIGAKTADPPVTDGEGAEKRIRERLAASLSLRLLFGSSAPLFTRLYAEGTLTHDFDFEVDYAAGTATILIGGEAPEPEKVFDALCEEAARIAAEGFDRAVFARAKKALIGGRLRGLEDFENVCITLVSDWFDGYCSFDSLDLLNDLRKEECEAWVRENLTRERLAMSVIRPLKGEA